MTKLFKEILAERNNWSIWAINEIEYLNQLGKCNFHEAK
jgi:hypothetical protein